LPSDETGFSGVALLHLPFDHAALSRQAPFATTKFRGFIMGTSANILIISNGEKASVTQYRDGYPKHVLENFANWIVTGDGSNLHSLDMNVWNLQCVHHMSYSDPVRQGNTVAELMPKDVFINVDTDTQAWNYVVDLDKRHIAIYCNDSSLDITPRPDGQTSDPMISLLGLKEDYVAHERGEIQQSLDKLAEARFTIN
jgi:hypothetical protein